MVLICRAPAAFIAVELYSPSLTHEVYSSGKEVEGFHLFSSGRPSENEKAKYINTIRTDGIACQN